MNCPNCKTVKGKPVVVDPIRRTCSKCGALIVVNHHGQMHAIGGRKPAAKPAAPATKA
jgi:hypothetical protein